MGSFGIWELLIIMIIVALLFGTKKLKGIGSDLGGAVKGFQNAMKDGEDNSQTKDPDHAIENESVEKEP